MKNLKIREELEKDYYDVHFVVKEAFEGEAHSDGTEYKLVRNLRKSSNYINELALVATNYNKVVGHVMFTKIKISNENGQYEVLALAPLAVKNNHRNMGIGSMLVKEGLKKAEELGYGAVAVLGNDEYYSRFGFKEAKKFGIECPFDVPSKNFMIIELKKGALKDVSGKVVYPEEFSAE